MKGHRYLTPAQCLEWLGQHPSISFDPVTSHGWFAVRMETKSANGLPVFTRIGRGVTAFEAVAKAHEVVEDMEGLPND